MCDTQVLIAEGAVWFANNFDREPSEPQLVRLGLERAASAGDAARIMTELLERYGQGGPAGREDRGFCYDSSFVVADCSEAWVLEAAGRSSRAARCVDACYAILNALTIGSARRSGSQNLAVVVSQPVLRRFSQRAAAQMPFDDGCSCCRSSTPLRQPRTNASGYPSQLRGSLRLPRCAHS